MSLPVLLQIQETALHAKGAEPEENGSSRQERVSCVSEGWMCIEREWGERVTGGVEGRGEENEADFAQLGVCLYLYVVRTLG